MSKAVSKPVSAAFGPEVLAHVAKLARIALTEDEAKALGADLANIVGYVGMLARVPLDPAAQDDAPLVTLRADEPTPSLDVRDFAPAAPEMEDRAFVVPAFLGRGSGS